MAVEVTITHMATGIFAEGNSYEEANANLSRVLSAYQGVLERIEGNLGYVLKGHLDNLRRHNH